MNFQSDDADVIVKAIMAYLTSKGRMDLLPKILDGLKKYKSDQTGVLEVITSYQLEDQEKEDVKKAIATKFGELSEIKFVTDKSILGGVLIRFQDKVVDLSLLGKLNEIEKNID